MPPKIMIDYLLLSFKCEMIIMAVQPKSLEFNRPLSKEVGAAVKEASRLIGEAIRNSQRRITALD